MPPEPVGAQPGAEGPLRGGYARQEVDVGALRAAPQPFELSLALPFGSLFSALLPARSFRVRTLQLEYVDPDRLGPQATYSVQVGDREGGALELRLLVARGAWLCVRGRAWLELEPPAAKSNGADSQSAQKRGNSHG
jgi:hypothetical protein